MYYSYDLNGKTTEERIGGHRPAEEREEASYSYRNNVTIADRAFAWTRDTGDDSVYNRQYYWNE